MRITQLYAVVEHAQMVGAHRADVDGLDAAHPTVVLNLHTRKIAYGIGHRMAVETLKAGTAEPLAWNHLAVRLALTHHLHLAEVQHRVNLGLLR